MTDSSEESDPSATPSDRGVASEGDGKSATGTLAKQGSITFAGDVFGKVFGFLIVAVITRLVSPSIYGLFVLATSLVLAIQTFAGLGLPKAIDYFVPQYLRDGEVKRARAVIVTVMAVVLVSSTAVAVFLLLTRQFIADTFSEPALAFALLLLAVTFPLLAIYNVLLASFNAIKQLQYRVYTRNVVRPTVRFFVTATLLLSGWGLIGLVGGYIVGLLAATVVGTLLLVRNAPELVGRPQRAASPRPLLAYGAPLAIAGLIYTFLGQIDYFVLGFFASANEVGIYRVGYMLASNLLIFFTAVAPVFKPLIAEVHTQDALVQARYQTATRWVAGLTLPVTIVIALGASTYLSLVFTPQYSVASFAVIALCIGFLINVTCGGPDGPILQGMGYSRLVFINTLVLLGTNAVLSVLLVPEFGVTGAGVATGTALAVTGIATVSEAYFLRGIHPFTRDLAKLFVAAVPATIAGAGVVVLFPRVIIAFLLPIVVLGVYILCVLGLDGIVEEDAEFAAHVSPAAKRFVTAARTGE